MSRRLLAAAVAVLAVVVPSPASADSEREQCAAAAEAAQRQRDASALLEARRQLLVCTREVCPAVIRSDCSVWLVQVNTALPSIAVRARDAAGHDVVDATVRIDGKIARTRLDGTPIDVDPGEHVVDVEAPGVAPAAERILATQGEKSRAVVVTFGAPAPAHAEVRPPTRDERASPPSSGGRRTWGLVAGAAGIGGLLAFGALQLVAHGEHADLKEGCGATRSCDAAAVSDVRGLFVASGISLAGAVVLLGAGAWLLFGPGGHGR